jgi:hypothetical protein
MRSFGITQVLNKIYTSIHVYGYMRYLCLFGFWAKEIEHRTCILHLFQVFRRGPEVQIVEDRLLMYPEEFASQ